MNKEKIRKVLLLLGFIFLLVYVAAMVFEINNFSPYHTRWFLWSDRALEFLLPSILCFIIRTFLKSKN